ncbi:hypothetical protein [Microbacterium sp. BH-3-3-3]|uniref:hypothetical protein n=1 Tax=Microbacterium sp. BH-3-3-3 TaxID=1906742 RepID=UPI0008927E04|nr:hypothetical protein [Microbacterium sp. BH-3-3-3]AOX46940.1 hypothetical protein BJP65_15015 [Microbacterium sp. BH-3-3-3]
MSSVTPPPPEPYDPPVARAGAAEPAYGAPAAPAYAPPPSSRGAKGSRTLGLIAFLASMVGVVVGIVCALIAGLQSGSLAQYADASGEIDPNTLPPGTEQTAILIAVLSVTAFAVYGIFGLWGFIQGIVAAVKNRGRGWGIAAVVIAVLGGIAVIVAFVGGVGLGVAPSM